MRKWCLVSTIFCNDSRLLTVLARPPCGTSHGDSFDPEQVLAHVGYEWRSNIPDSCFMSLATDPGFSRSTLTLKWKCENEEREEFGNYQNVRIRFEDLPIAASASSIYRGPGAKAGAKAEMRKCKFCPQCFWTSEDRRIHETIHEKKRT